VNNSSLFGIITVAVFALSAIFISW